MNPKPFYEVEWWILPLAPILALLWLAASPLWMLYEARNGTLLSRPRRNDGGHPDY